MMEFDTSDGRTHIPSRLMRESLQDRDVIAQTDSDTETAIYPDVRIVGIGGQSIFDRGAAAVRPLVKEITALRGKHQLVLGIGGGTRVRHTCAIALDLGIPVGGMARLIGGMEEVNAMMLAALLVKHGAILLGRDHFWDIPMYVAQGLLPIVVSNPPYHYWEPPPRDGPLPMHGSDFGLFMHAEVMGTPHIIFVKDENGLYDKHPRKHADAKLIEKITLDELLANLPEETILDRHLFHAWKNARHVKKVQIVNGLVPCQLTKALAGEDVGTVILKEASRG